MKKYRITGHNSFHLREGWINKIFSKVYENQEENKLDQNYFGKGNQIKVIDRLGIGSAMVDSVKFWCEVLGIIEKEDSKLVLSSIGKSILKYDKYLENENTLWLLHFNIFNRDDEVLIIWDTVFNNKYSSNFSKELIEERIRIIYTEEGKDLAQKSIHDSVGVFLRTYCENSNEIEDYEENISSPFRRLNYIQALPNKEYKIRNIPSEEISEYLIYYIIYICKIKNKERMQVSMAESYELINERIRMSSLEYEKIIQKLEILKLLSVDRAAGLENINFKAPIEKEEEILKLILEREENR